MGSTNISVIVPNFNHARYLTVSLPAILSQSYRPHEVIVVDDASTDDSLRVLEGFAEEHPTLKLIRHTTNSGTVVATQSGLSAATGEYVYLASADDLLLPGFFEESMSLLLRHPTAGFCSTLARIIDQTGADKGLFQPYFISRSPCFIAPDRAHELLLQHGSWFLVTAVIFRRQAFFDGGGYDPKLHSFADDFLCQVLACRFGACFIPRPLVTWRRYKGTYSRRINADYDVSRAMFVRAGELMRTKHRGLFSNRLIARCELRWKYHTLVNHWDAQLDAFCARHRSALLEGSLWRRPALLLLHAFEEVGRALIRSCCFVRFRISDTWSVLLRRLRILAFPSMNGPSRP